MGSPAGEMRRWTADWLLARSSLDFTGATYSNFFLSFDSPLPPPPVLCPFHSVADQGEGIWKDWGVVGGERVEGQLITDSRCKRPSTHVAPLTRPNYLTRG